MKSNFYRVPAVVLSVLFGATLATALASAATTISTDIQTDGTLSVGSATATTTLAGGLNVANGGLLYDRSTGHVGIGTANPLNSLDVAGNISTNFTTTNQTRTIGIGMNSGLPVGSTAQLLLGDGLETLSVSYGQPWLLNDYHGLIIQSNPQYGGFAGSAVLFVTSISSNTSGVPILIAKGASSQTADIFQVQNSASTTLFNVTASGSVGVATSTPIANFQATAASNNATTTMEVGKSGQNKGSCLKLYRTDGSAIYAYVAAGATAFTLTTSACASVANF